MEAIKRFLQDDSGISATEYVVLAALITAGIVGAVSGVGGALEGFFNKMATWIGSQTFAGT
jgi:pilus assembly protein Flp/PilA